MSNYRLRYFGDPVLTQRAVEITDIDGALVNLADSMVDVMYEAQGVGLAAPQVGVQKRLFIYQIDDEEPLTIINPTITESRGEWSYDEGCLSIPGLSWNCVRKEHVVAHGQNEYGDPITVEGTARLARCIQHETDHLDGVLFVDRLDPETRRAAMAEIRNAEWSGLAAPVIKVSPHTQASSVFGRVL